MANTNYSDLVPNPEVSPAKELNLFYVIDVSGSMGGSKIESVNQVMPEVMKIVGEISDANADNATIKASILTFEDEPRWMYPQPVYAKEMIWQDLSVGGGTYFGEMCLKLEQALHKDTTKYPEAQLNCKAGHKKSVIIILSDGQPLDLDWEQRGFLKLSNNEWFKEASKIAIAIGNDCDKEVLRKFVGGGQEAKIYDVHNSQQLKNYIMTASSVASKIGSAKADASQDSINKAMENEIKLKPNPTSAIDDFD